MGILLMICAIVGLVSLLGDGLNAIGNVTVALLRYVIGPVLILGIILGCLKYGI